MTVDRPIAVGPGGRVLTHANVWSPDGQWIAFDTRSDAAGSRFDGTAIRIVHADTGEIRTLYESQNGAHCGVVTWHPMRPLVAFILGPEHPTADWTYGPARRRGVVVEADRPGIAVPLDARNLVAPHTPGALRGGSHVHVWNPVGDRLSFTYEDHVLASSTNPEAEPNRRTVAVCVPGMAVDVPNTHPRNHSGTAFSAVISQTVPRPRPGSDEISRAVEDSWVGRRSQVAFLGRVTTADGREIDEVFVADVPADLTRPGDGPLEGTSTRYPAPPHGTAQRRLTRTESHRFPGVSGPRHWLRSSPDGSRIGFLKPDDAGTVQLWTVSPDGGPPVQLTSNRHPVASAFTWHPDGRRVAFICDDRVCLADAVTGETVPLTEQCHPRPEACAISPDGRRIAYVRRGNENEIWVADVR